MFVINKVLMALKLHVPGLGPVKLNRGQSPYFTCTIVVGSARRQCSIMVQEFEGSERTRLHLCVEPWEMIGCGTTSILVNDRHDRDDMSPVYAEAFRTQDFLLTSQIKFKGDPGYRNIALVNNLFFAKPDKSVARSVVATLLVMTGELEQFWDELISLAALSNAELKAVDSNKP